MGKKENLVILILAFLPFVMVIGNSMFIPILPIIERDLHISSAEAGLLLTAFSIPAAIIIPFIGYFSQKFGAKKMIITSLLFILIGSLISSLAPFIGESRIVFNCLIVGRAIQGFGAGGTAPLAMTIIGNVFLGTSRSKALGMMELFNGLGKMISPLLGVTAVFFTWYSAFWFYFILSLTILLLIQTYIDSDSKGIDLSILKYFHSVGGIFKREYRWIFPVYFTGASIMFILFGLFVYFSYEIEQVYLIESIEKGVLFSIPLGGLTIASYFSGRFIGAKNENLQKIVVISFISMVTVLIFGMILHSFTVLFIIITVFSIGAGLLLPCCNLLVTSNISKEERGVVVSFYGMFRFLGVAFGPLIYSQWMYMEWWMFMYSFFILIIVGVSLYLGFMTVTKRETTISPFSS
ncbi:MFS transporter [Evansella sp. AB-P1]|uniref:MFS transporter n=1 Tax=Evansella sp. AB-P1 TaxID=3037653 RepID=UPI00241FAC83|nr:MFS transporter [Evansella sp. AB-P1]MDG5788765.1 MFS transporter [Evansella sp. AB-P1]